MKQKWTPFWLETNSTFGIVDSAEVWVQKRHEWDKDASRYGICPDEIYELKSHDRDSNDKSQTPSFGSRREHIGGKMTLGLFFALHGMDRSIGGHNVKISCRNAVGLGDLLDIKEINMHCDKWNWCMDYCKRNGLPPAQEWAWKKASTEYRNMMEVKKQDDADYYNEHANNDNTTAS